MVKTRILIIGLTPPDEGGSQIHREKIVKYLDKERYNIKLLTQKGSFLENKIEVPYSKTKIQYFNSLIFCAFSLLKLFFSRKYDIIHMHESFLFPFLKFIRKKCKKLVVTVHGMKGFKFYDNKSFWPKFRKGLKKVDTLIAVSLDIKEILEKEGFSNVCYIPNGVNLKVYPKISKILNQISFIGRIHKQKGLVYLVKAFEEVVKKYPKFKLILIGKKEGEYYKNLLRYIKENKIPNIEFLGFFSDEKQRVKILSESYANVLPSLWEGLPLTLFECLASKRPLIISKLPQIKSIVKNNAILIKPKSVKNLSFSMEKLIENPKKADRLGLKGFNLSKNYSWEKIARKTEEVYEK